VIDRIDVIDSETVRVRDYKTNRVVFYRDEVNESLQLSLYAVAVRRMYPWVKRVELQFDMLQHDIKLKTSRTQLDAARAIDSRSSK
jgi:RecB family exonuclease